jgi:hypothetical protein
MATMASKIRPEMKVLGSDNKVLGHVAAVLSRSHIRLAPNENGRPHTLALSSVAMVDPWQVTLLMPAAEAPLEAA